MTAITRSFNQELNNVNQAIKTASNHAAKTSDGLVIYFGGYNLNSHAKEVCDVATKLQNCLNLKGATYSTELKNCYRDFNKLYERVKAFDDITDIQSAKKIAEEISKKIRELNPKDASKIDKTAPPTLQESEVKHSVVENEDIAGRPRSKANVRDSKAPTKIGEKNEKSAAAAVAQPPTAKTEEVKSSKPTAVKKSEEKPKTIFGRTTVPFTDAEIQRRLKQNKDKAIYFVKEWTDFPKGWIKPSNAELGKVYYNEKGKMKIDYILKDQNEFAIVDINKKTLLEGFRHQYAFNSLEDYLSFKGLKK